MTRGLLIAGFTAAKVPAIQRNAKGSLPEGNAASRSAAEPILRHGPLSRPQCPFGDSPGLNSLALIPDIQVAGYGQRVLGKAGRLCRFASMDAFHDSSSDPDHPATTNPSPP